MSLKKINIIISVLAMIAVLVETARGKSPWLLHNQKVKNEIKSICEKKEHKLSEKESIKKILIPLWI